MQKRLDTPTPVICDRPESKLNDSSFFIHIYLCHVTFVILVINSNRCRNQLNSNWQN
jgi:hypothetical protein